MERNMSYWKWINTLITIFLWCLFGISLQIWWGKNGQIPCIVAGVKMDKYKSPLISGPHRRFPWKSHLRMKAKSSHPQLMLSSSEAMSEDCNVGAWISIIYLQVVIQASPPVSVQEDRWKGKEWTGLDVWLNWGPEKKGEESITYPLTCCPWFL